VKPDHFDVAPEVNVYLARDPRRLEPVRSLIQAARRSIQMVSPDTRVLVSFNREAMSGGYGRGSFLPFGRLVLPNHKERDRLLTLFEDVDEAGLTSWPQSAFNSPTEVPNDHFLALKPLFKGRPLPITSLNAVWNPAARQPEIEQASYLRHLTQCCYWLNAPLIAYPEALSALPPKASAAPDLALRSEDKDRLALTVWRATLGWKHVPRLTARAAEFGADGPNTLRGPN
jgi:hypothetical protein